jgi:NTP pyrophosphatase (non-canonical NTP hydrolase)
MEIADYQQEVQRTCATSNREDTVKLALIGLQDELGEIAGPLKKHLWHGHDLDLAHVQDEIGDLVWYLATLCNTLEISLAEVLLKNMEKLYRRYPHGFSSERSINRTEWDDAASHTSEGRDQA